MLLLPWTNMNCIEGQKWAFMEVVTESHMKGTGSKGIKHFLLHLSDDVVGG